jgi:hypothetical protein
MNAKERFKKLPNAVERLNEVKLLIMYECDDWRPHEERVSKSISDPTAQRAIHLVDEVSEKLEALRSEESELESFIGESLVLIQAVHDGFGEIYAILLEARYIDGLSWSMIHDDYGIARSTGYRLIGIAFDWIDSMGVSRLLKGETEL